MYGHSNGNTADYDVDYAVRSDSWGGTWLKHQQLAATPATEYVKDAKCYREPGNIYMDAALVVSDTAALDSAVVQYTWVNSDAPRSWLAPVKVSDTLKVAYWPEPVVVFSPGAAPYPLPGILFSLDGHYGAWFNAAWFGAGTAEPGQPAGRDFAPGATIVHGMLGLPSASGVARPARSVLLDISGRAVALLAPGANDVSRFAPGVYFVRQTTISGTGTRKVVFE